MPMPQTRPQHLKHAVEAHLKLAPATALDRLTRLDPVLGSFVAHRQQQFVAMLDRLPIAATVFAEMRRYTAAHELGHFLLGHQPSLDDTPLRRTAKIPGTNWQHDYGLSRPD